MFDYSIRGFAARGAFAASPRWPPTPPPRRSWLIQALPALPRSQRLGQLRGGRAREERHGVVALMLKRAGGDVGDVVVGGVVSPFLLDEDQVMICRNIM